LNRERGVVLSFCMLLILATFMAFPFPSVAISNKYGEGALNGQDGGQALHYSLAFVGVEAEVHRDERGVSIVCL